MNPAAAESPPAGLAGTTQVAVKAPPRRKPPGAGRWPHSRWLMLIALVFAAHIAFLFAFGAREQIVPRPATNVPMLKLAAEASELLALNDPTLFALPHQRDFASAVRVQTSVLKQPSFRWTEPPRWLPLSVEALGTVFDEFMQTNRFAGFELQLKPPLKLSAPGLPIEPVLAQTSTLQIEDRLAQRRLLDPLNLPSWPYADVLAPSVVQTVVDAAGNVVSVVLLSPGSGWDDADRRALELARAARFAPAPRLTIGRLIFNWHTVPMTNTNEPSR